MTDSQRLLAEYAQTGSESAFRELVSRYLNFVYSTALRLVGGDAHLAQDVAQTVFISLASKGRMLSDEVMLGGWLHQHTFYVATKAVRTERRRKSREREAVEMNLLQDDSESWLQQVAPILDEAITKLESDDRTAILLRFFEEKNFRSVGEALGSNEDAARMRVNRALEKLHLMLKDRGVILSSAALITVLTTKVVTAAPIGMAATISGIALSGAAAGVGTIFSISRIMASTKLKLSLATLIIAGAVTTLVVQQKLYKSLHDENESIRRQIAQLKADNESLASLATQSNKPATLQNDQFMELLRLRGEVGVLRAQKTDLARLQKENQILLSKLVAQSDYTNQVSAEDQLTLQKTHLVDATTLLLNAIKSYAANHDGQYPGNMEQLTANRDIGTTNFVGSLGFDDFKFIKDGAVDQKGNKAILSIQVPIQGSENTSLIVVGGINEDGHTYTEIRNSITQ